jgi:hypothetical protein
VLRALNSSPLDYVDAPEPPTFSLRVEMTFVRTGALKVLIGTSNTGE